MGVLREVDFARFLQRGITSQNLLLIHGSDEASVANFALRITKHFGSESIRLESSTCKASPGALGDAFFSLSLLGDRQLIIIDDVGDDALGFLGQILEANSPANFILLTAGSLTKKSKLRVAIEAAGLCSALAVYEEDEAALRERINRALDKNSLRWGEGAELEFFAIVGSDRSTVNQEIEKLMLYAHGQSEISQEDVVQVCGDTAEFGADDLIDAILRGDLETTDRIFASLVREASSFMPLFSLHITRLQSFQAEIEAGIGTDAVVNSPKSGIFFKRKRAIQDQLRLLNMHKLVDVQQTLQETNLLTRKNAILAEAITSRAILSIARSCRSKA